MSRRSDNCDLRGLGLDERDRRLILARLRRERVRMIRGRRRGGWVMSLNLTPMIDTVFNLLFFFMIVSRFGAIEGLLPAPLPARTGAAQVAVAEIPRTPLRVRLQATSGASPCRVTIDRFGENGVELRGLAAALEQIRTSAPGFDADAPVYLLAGDDVAWDHVVNAYNAALTAQYRKVFFASGQ